MIRDSGYFKTKKPSFCMCTLRWEEAMQSTQGTRTFETNSKQSLVMTSPYQQQVAQEEYKRHSSAYCNRLVMHIKNSFLTATRADNSIFDRWRIQFIHPFVQQIRACQANEMT
jgi:hypothetical protein